MDGVSLVLNALCVGLAVCTVSLFFFFAVPGPGVSWLDRAVKVWVVLAGLVVALSTLLRFVRMEE